MNSAKAFSQRSDALFPQGGSNFPESFCFIDEACFAGAHGGASLADFIQVSTLHGWVYFTRETGEEIFYQGSASADRQTERFLRDHFYSKSHATKILSAVLDIKTHIGWKDREPCL
jgi:hypothetical protein